MKLSLVTGTLNRPESLQRLITSIETHTTVDWELVISDASEIPFRTDNPRIKVLHEKPRLGCTRGYNRAFRAAAGYWVIWLNDDAEVLRAYDIAAIRFMESHPKIGIGALHYSECGGPFHVNEAWGATYPNFGILLRSVGDEVGWMDEEIEMYGCDNSLAFKILLTDRGVADIPEARVIHHSVKDQTRIDNQKNRQRDNKRLTEKYMPLRRHWLFAFRRHRVDSGVPAWSHGVQPEVVAR